MARQGKLEPVTMHVKKPQPTATPKNRIEREENEDLEVDEGLPESGTSKADEGIAETPAHTEAEPKVPHRKSANDVSNPEAVVEEMRNQDA